MIRPRTPLFNAATDAPDGGGATATPTPTPAASESPGSESPGLQVSESSPKPGVIAQAAALLRGANGNAATIASLRADVTTRDATIEQLRSDLAARDATIASLTTELTTFRTQAADLQSAITALQTKQTDVQTEVIHQLAVAGIPEQQLPQGSKQVQTEETIDALREKLSDPSIDSVERGKIAQKIRALRAKN